MEVAFVRVLGHDPGLLKEKVGDLAADRLATGEQNLDVFALKI